MLYLEGHVAIGAFTPQRAAVLDLLAAQAAISLENARLYADLRRSEAFLSDGQSISHTGSWSWEAPTGLLVWSDEHYRIFGADPRSWAPTVARIYRMIHPEDRAAVRRTVQSSVRNGAAFTCECRLICSHGVRHLHVVGRPSSERLGGYQKLYRNDSRFERLQTGARGVAGCAVRPCAASRLTAVGELTSLIAHEVRQPLTAIAARAGACRSWLAHDPPNISAAAASVTGIVEYAHRANGVIESIRQMTRKSAPAQTPLDVNEAIRETCHSVAERNSPSTRSAQGRTCGRPAFRLRRSNSAATGLYEPDDERDGGHDGCHRTGPASADQFGNGCVRTSCWSR